MKEETITLDLREDIRAGREPFSRIMAAASQMEPGKALLIIAPFEPKPLFPILAKHGFRHTSQQTATGEWQVLFSAAEKAPIASNPVLPTSPGCDRSTIRPAEVIELNARGLEPPQPMVKILEALATLPAGTELHARTDRRPMHLYPQLEERGFTAETLEQTDGSFLTQIRHR